MLICILKCVSYSSIYYQNAVFYTILSFDNFEITGKRLGGIVNLIICIAKDVLTY